MSLKILYFASLREALACSGESLALPPQVCSVADLRAHLAQRGGAWTRLVESKSLRVAVNQQMATDDAPLAGGDEVAFFPPVTGG